MKRFKILLHEDAIADLKIALQYDREIGASLENRFLIQANKALEELIKNPFYQIRYDNFRMKVVKKFPYVIHFIVDENESIVYVYGIRNSLQNPTTSYIKT